jgi:hypothetical protein
MQTIPESQPRADNADVVADSAPAETLHAVLASQARDRTKLELWAGTLVGGANAALIWTRFPSLHWLAAGFAATAFYGAWGLLDRQVSDCDASPTSTRLSRILIRMPRLVSGALGWGAALFAIGAFLTAALGGLSFPGR